MTIINNKLNTGQKSSDFSPVLSPKKSNGFLGPKNSSEGIFRSPKQNPEGPDNIGNVTARGDVK